MARAERKGIFFEITGVEDQAAAEAGLDAALRFLRDTKVDAFEKLRAQEEVIAKAEEIDRWEMGEDFEPALELTEMRIALVDIA